MNMLIIGNGFDLAHGLPTSYKDFLKFVNLANAILEDDLATITKIETSDGNDDKEIIKTKNFKDFIIFLKNKSDFKYIEEIHKLSYDNLWFNYFNDFKSKHNTWIDFESEISKVVQILETVKINKDTAIIYKNDTFEVHFGIKEIIKPFKYKKIIVKKYKDENDKNAYIADTESYLSFIDKLLEDLNRLIRCLEIYLSSYINSLDIKTTIPEICELYNIDYVLSFNYTDTFEKLYGKAKNISYNYIHGKANLKNNVENCQLILGIDDYLDDERSSKYTDFIQYKKYFQRVYKETGCEYSDWLKKINKDISDEKELNVYIFGHSLDATDKDIFKEILTNEFVKVHIYYHNKNSLGEKIANLVKIISKEKLIEYTSGKKRKINFIKQIEVKEPEEKNIVQSEIKEVSTIAAHNDHLKDPDEKEKILDDFNDIDEW